MVDIKLIQGDCLDKMKDIPDVSIDAIITDPPYGTTACKWDSIIPFDEMWVRLNKLIKPNGAIVLFGCEPFSSALRMSNIKNYKYDWVWGKESPSNFFQAKYCPLSKTENISVFGEFGINSGSKKIGTYNPQGIKTVNKEKVTSNYADSYLGKAHKSSLKKGVKYIQKFENYPTRIIKINRDKNALHPTQKPVALMEYLIKTYTNEGDTVLDFTMGSGSTGVACVNTNRNFIGIELDEGYFKIAQDRINQAVVNINKQDGRSSCACRTGKEGGGVI